MQSELGISVRRGIYKKHTYMYKRITNITKAWHVHGEWLQIDKYSI